MSRSALACAATLGAALIVTGCTLIDREVVRRAFTEWERQRCRRK